MAWPDGEPLPILASDGATLALFSTFGDGSPLLLLHGTAGDHTTFRVIGPRLEATQAVHALDRRGRGASSDAPPGGPPYAITREFDDVATVAEVLAADAGRPIDVFGHSYGGRCALGAALRTDAIRRVISYEGAPAPPGTSYHDHDLEADLTASLAAGDPASVLATFMRRVVGMTGPELDAYRADPVWPTRVAAAPTIVRELSGEAQPDASVEVLGRIRQPVLQILGGASLPVFRASTVALDERLIDGRIVEIPGAKHAAHHTHPDAVVDAVTAFLRD